MKFITRHSVKSFLAIVLISLLVQVSIGLMALQAQNEVVLLNEVKNYPSPAHFVLEAAFCQVIVDKSSTSVLTAEIKIRGKAGSKVTLNEDLENNTRKLSLISNTSKGLKGEIIIKVPSGTRLTLSTQSGNFRLRQFPNSEINVSTVSGNITADGLEGNLFFTTKSGSIRAEGLRGEMTIESSSGEINLLSFQGNLMAKTSSGPVYLRKGNGTISIENRSNFIHLYEMQGELRVKNASGRIKGTDMMIKENSSFVTTSGEIQLDLLNKIEEIDWDLKSSSGGIWVGGQAANNQFQRVKSRPIKLSTQSQSGRQEINPKP